MASNTRVRPRITTTGAEAVLDDFVATAGGAMRGVDAARVLRRSRVDWREVRAGIVAADGSVVLAEHPAGPVLAARHTAAGEATTVHDHGSAGAAMVVEGAVRYERFEPREDGTVRLESTHDLHIGDVAWWAAPPDDVHRQAARAGSTIELVLIARMPSEPNEFRVVDNRSSFERDVTAALLDGRVDLLERWYASDVLGDLNVPQWRFQIRGRRELLGTLQAEEFDQPGRRMTFLRTTETGSGLVAETECRYEEDGERRQFREIHHLRCRGGRVVEHVVWCSGVADGSTIDRHFAEAPVERM